MKSHRHWLSSSSNQDSARALRQPAQIIRLRIGDSQMRARIADE